jgi:hypothetical protein
MESYSEEVRKLSFDLFKALFKKGLGFNIAINAALKGMKNREWNIKYLALILFKGIT